MTVRNEPDTRTDASGRALGRRPGRQALVDSAADLLASSTLQDVVGACVGVRDVAAAAGVAPATVNHHFPAGGGRKNLRLCTAVIHHALLRSGLPVTEATAKAALDAADDLRSGDPEALRRLARAAADDLIGFSPGPGDDPRVESEVVAILLAAAVAPRSAEATDALASYYGSLREIHIAMFDGLLDASGRRLVAGIEVQDLAYVINALADGFLLRRRFEPERMTPSLFAESVIRLFESFTALLTEPQDSDPTDRLLPPPRGSNLDPHKRVAIVDAARTVYDRVGWPGLTLGAVADEAGVSRATVVANFRDRGGLAASIWARFLPALVAGIEEDEAAGRTLLIITRRHLARLAEVARQHHRLTGALLEAVFAQSIEHGAPRTDDPADPRTLVPLPSLLATVVGDHADAFRTGYAENPSDIYDTAALLTNQALHLCITRPLLTAAEVAHRVVDTTLAGMLRRRPSGG